MVERFHENGLPCFSFDFWELVYLRDHSRLLTNTAYRFMVDCGVPYVLSSKPGKAQDLERKITDCGLVITPINQG